MSALHYNKLSQRRLFKQLVVKKKFSIDLTNLCISDSLEKTIINFSLPNVCHFTPLNYYLVNFMVCYVIRHDRDRSPLRIQLPNSYPAVCIRWNHTLSMWPPSQVCDRGAVRFAIFAHNSSGISTPYRHCPCIAETKEVNMR